jgi:hypothetical protein
MVMSPLLYFKAVVGAVGATVFPPIVNYLLTFIVGGVPSDVRTALSILIVALLTGGVVYTTPNQQSAGRPQPSLAG